MNYWEIITHSLSKAGWSLGWVSAVDSGGEQSGLLMRIAMTGRRFIVHSDEKLSAFVELERQVLTATFYLESITLPSIIVNAKHRLLQT